MTTDDAKFLIDNDEDFVYVKRFDYSLKKLLEKYPDGAPDRVIAQALMITEEDVEKTYQHIVQKLKDSLGLDDA